MKLTRKERNFDRIFSIIFVIGFVGCGLALTGIAIAIAGNTFVGGWLLAIGAGMEALAFLAVMFMLVWNALKEAWKKSEDSK